MPDRIHILLTIPNFDTAGSGKVVYDLADRIDKERFKVSIMCRTDQGAFFKEIEQLNLPIHLMDFNTSVRPYLGLLKRLKPFRSFLKEHQVDIVHSWNWSSDWTEPLACRMAGVKFIYTKKSMSWGNRHWKIRSLLSHYIITLNRDMRDFFPWKKNQQLIPLGIDENYYDPEQIKADKDNSKLKIITVANLVPVKNIETIIQAMHKLNDLPVSLDIVGDENTDYTAKLKKIAAELDVSERIRFKGKLADVRPSLKSADLYIISSKTEGMPMALVEAMCMGIPVLGADSPGINYVLKEFPELLFPFSDANALAGKIRAHFELNTEERQSIGLELRTYCMGNLTINDFIDNHEKLYLNLLNRTL